ncbi:metal ABC transporter permease [Microbacterium sp. gxy059]|uniref:metal ABC transporter permease n=1 Tax=Microbacterium sp. gxy059 TaxID=2957199 RepID=UPI003D99F603
MARSIGLPVFWIDLGLYVMVTVAVVISVQTIGNILVLALLVVPAATARLLTDRLPVMMALAPALGAVSTFVGLYLSWAIDLPTGGTIVLTATALFLAAWLGAPQHGVAGRIRRSSRRRPASAPRVGPLSPAASS